MVKLLKEVVLCYMYCVAKPKSPIKTKLFTVYSSLITVAFNIYKQTKTYIDSVSVKYYIS